MPIAKITGPGLAAIGISVALLWSCVVCERMMVDRAYNERARVMHDVLMRQQKQRPEQVSSPLAKPHRLRVTAG